MVAALGAFTVGAGGEVADVEMTDDVVDSGSSSQLKSSCAACCEADR